MRKISLIVPVHNGDMHLEDCIRSILNRTYKNIEVILIDDGSTDTSGSICDKYAESYSNVQVVHQKNRGVSASRNIGLKLATGYYIGFIDCDDTVEYDMYESLIALADTYNADMVSCNIAIINYSKRLSPNTTTDQIQIFSKDDVMSNFLHKNIGGISSCNRIYRTKIAKKCAYSENIKNNEDKLFLYDICKKANKHIHLYAEKYNYHTRANSASTSTFNENFFDIRIVSQEIEQDVTALYPLLLPYAQTMSIISQLHLLRLLILSSKLNEHMNNFYSIRKSLIEYKNIELSPIRRIELELLRLSPHLYVYSVKAYGSLTALVNISKNQDSNG